MAKHSLLKSVSLAAILVMLTVGGCNSSWTTYGLFTRPELRAYDRLAVVGLTAEQEQIFMAAFLRAFSGRGVTFVERERISGILSNQDFFRGRFRDDTRARLQEMFGIEALITCEYSYGTLPAESKEKKLRVRILDTETAAIVGSVVVSKESTRPSNDRADFVKAADQACQALREHVAGVGFY